MDSEDKKNSGQDLAKTKVASMSKTLYASLCVLMVACLSTITLEVGARSPLGHSVTKSAAFNAIFRRSYNMKIYMQMGSFVASLLNTGLIIIGRKIKNPYLYLPWLMNTFKGIFLNEAPAFFNFTTNQMPYAPFATLIFALITIVLFVEELCIWWDSLESFVEAWEEYMHRNGTQIEFELNNVMGSAGDECNVENLDENAKGDRSFHEGVDSYATFNNSRRVKSLTNINYADKKYKNL